MYPQICYLHVGHACVPDLLLEQSQGRAKPILLMCWLQLVYSFVAAEQDQGILRSIDALRAQLCMLFYQVWCAAR